MNTYLRHPLTREPLHPVGHRRNGSPIWPILGGSEAAGTENGGEGGSGGAGEGGNGAPKPGEEGAKAPAGAKGGKGRTDLEAIEDPEQLRQMVRGGWAEAKDWRVKYQEARPIVEAHQKAEDEARPELERITARAEQAESRAGVAEQTALRYEVAFEQGLTFAQAKRLQGSTREEIEADAEEVKRDFPASTKDTKSPPAGKAREDLRPGAAPAGATAGPEPEPGVGRLRAAYDTANQ